MVLDNLIVWRMMNGERCILEDISEWLLSANNQTFFNGLVCGIRPQIVLIRLQIQFRIISTSAKAPGTFAYEVDLNSKSTS